MATCSEIQAEIFRLETIVVNSGNLVLAAQAARNAAANEGNLVKARSRLAEAESGISRLENARQQLLNLADEAVASNCFEQRQFAINLVSQANNNLTSLRRNIGLANTAIKNYEDAVKAEEGAAKENNAGTGTPGTAGQGQAATPDSQQLEEVEINSKKVPEPVTEPGAGDGLEEVEVTGKRNPTLISGDPAIDDQVDVDVEEPNFDFGDGTEAPQSEGSSQGLSGSRDSAQAAATTQDAANYAIQGDWRVRLSLAPGAKYLYRDGDSTSILAPLAETDGVVFPYTPNIVVNYTANYENTPITHSNFRVYQYQNSAVDQITITADFTAQDIYEARYLLAVIHFFRSVTKMFYGQDELPIRGSPPPLCYLFGLGAFQFNAHPLLVNSFNYSLPKNVDYIRTGMPNVSPGVNMSANNSRSNVNDTSTNRVRSGGQNVGFGGVPGNTDWGPQPSGTMEPTYVPTMIQIIVTAYPIVSRNDMSNSFSLKEYSKGKLLLGTQRAGKGGIW